MSGWTLRLTRDALAPATVRPLPRGNRVLYVREGEVKVRREGTTQPVAADSAWHAAGPCSLTGGDRGAVVLRWDLVPSGDARDGEALLEHAVDLDPAASGWLMRCDRVDFEAGGGVGVCRTAIAAAASAACSPARWTSPWASAPPRAVASGGRVVRERS